MMGRVQICFKIVIYSKLHKNLIKVRQRNKWTYQLSTQLLIYLKPMILGPSNHKSKPLSSQSLTTKSKEQIFRKRFHKSVQLITPIWTMTNNALQIWTQLSWLSKVKIILLISLTRTMKAKKVLRKDLFSKIT